MGAGLRHYSEAAVDDIVTTLLAGMYGENIFGRLLSRHSTNADKAMADLCNAMLLKQQKQNMQSGTSNYEIGLGYQNRLLGPLVNPRLNLSQLHEFDFVLGSGDAVRDMYVDLTAVDFLQDELARFQSIGCQLVPLQVVGCISM